MKKHTVRLLIAGLLLAALLAGCSSEGTDEAVVVEDVNADAPVIESVESSENGPCDNVFYPLKKDNQWIYRLDAYMDNFEGQEIESSSSDLALTVSEVGESNAVMAALDYDTGIVTQTTVQCEDQAIVNFPLTELNMVFGDLAGSLDIQYVSGKFMPSKKDFAGSNWSLEWETEYKASGTLEANYDGETLSAVLSESPVKMRWQVTGTGETQDVAAGTFNDLVKINREISIDIKSLKTYIEGEQIDIATTLTLDTNMYYAANIGLIKQDINSASIKLFGINFPLEAWGFVELKSYTLN